MKKLLYTIMLLLTITLTPALQAFTPSYNPEIKEFVITVPSDNLTVTPEAF